MNKNTGGPAFPITSSWYSHESGSGYVDYAVDGSNEGLTIRDWFAAKAMQGLIASPRGTPTGADATDTYYAEMAYIMADAMLAEREK